MGDILTYDDEVLTFNGSLLSWKDIDMPFQFTIDTNKSAGTTFIFSLSGDIDATVDWGDETTSTITSPTDPNREHIYAEEGIYTIKILGVCNGILFRDSPGLTRTKIISVDSWGNTNQIKNISFQNCTNLASFPNFGNALKDVTSLSFSFNNCNSLTHIDISNSDLSSVTTFFNAFSECSNLETANMSGLNLSSCSNISTVFSSCNNLISANISNLILNTNCSFSNFFNGCSSLINVNTTNTFSNGRVTNISSIFSNCTSIEELNLSDWDVSNVTGSILCFQQCSNLKTVDLSGWYLDKTTQVFSFFSSCLELINVYGYEDLFINNTNNLAINGFWSNCRKIEKIDMSKWTNNFTGINVLFLNCFELEEIIGVEDFNVSLSTQGIQTFRGIKKIKSLDLSNWDISNFQNVTSMFQDTELETLDLSNWDFSNCTDMTQFFRGSNYLSNIIGINNSTINKVENITAVFYDCDSITSLDLSNWDVSNVTIMNANLASALSTFENASGLTELNLSGWGNHKTSNLRAFFNGCESLENIIDFENFINSGVTRADFVFRNCKSLSWIDASNWDTTNITNPQGFFENCEILSGVTNIENLNWSNADNFSRFFNNCQKLSSLDLSNWDISNSTNLTQMFSSCIELTELNLSGWTFDNKIISTVLNDGIFYNCTLLNNIIGLEYINIIGVTNIRSVFRDCQSFTSLDLSHWDTSSVENMSATFYGCTGLTELNLSGWTFENISAIANLNNFLRDVTLNTTDYDNILINLSNQNLNNNITFNGGNSKYSTTGQAARSFIISEFNWSFSDGGLET